jgi:SAM-dependent methyltransferase
MPTDDARQFSPAAERNKQPILEVLKRVLPPRGLALEIASGTGQHVAHFAAGMPDWTWQPSDSDRAALASIAAWCAALANVRAPLLLDVMSAPWPMTTVDAIYCANMLHISPWATCAALMRAAARHLSSEGTLVTYGPYLVDGEDAAPSNVAFDADLRARNRQWGLRHLDDVLAQAQASGLALQERVAMPAHNLTLVFRRSATGLAKSE